MRWTLSVALLVCALAAAASASSANAATPADQQLVAQAFDLSPALFVENQGQWDARARYGFQGKRLNVFFTDEGPVFSVSGRGGDQDAPLEAASFSVTFAGANRVSPTAVDPSPTVMNYHFGNDPSKWQTGVSTYTKVAYKGLYDGIDLYTWGTRSGLKYEFHVAPGASWRDVVIEYDGIDGLSIDDSGALVAKTALGVMVDSAPLVYQDTPSGRVTVKARYKLIDAHSYRFDISGPYDPALPVVIDPELAWGTYLGGSVGAPPYPEWNHDAVTCIAADPDGNMYAVGGTSSTDFPTPNGRDQHLDGDDGFVVKIAPSGEIIWGSYLGGDSDEYARDAALDESGYLWIVGYTSSSDFPVTNDAFDKTRSDDLGTTDGFVVKMSLSGSIVWGSYLGGKAPDMQSEARIAVDSKGNAWVAGDTQSSDFPTPGGKNPASVACAHEDAGVFLVKITPAGQLVWGDIVSERHFADGLCIAIDERDNLWLGVTTNDPDMPTPGGFQKTLLDKLYGDSFVMKMSPECEVVWGSYLGHPGCAVRDIAVDPLDNVWVVGCATSVDWSQPTPTDSQDFDRWNAFVARITPEGRLSWARILAGCYEDIATSVATDHVGNAFVAGHTRSSDFPIVNGSGLHGYRDVFLMKVGPDGQLLWSTAIGGAFDEQPLGMVIDGARNLWVAGYTHSGDFPVPGGFDTALGDESNSANYDAFIIRLSPSAPTVATSHLADGYVNVDYRQTLLCSGEHDPFTWSISAGDLPDGLSLDPSTGEITGSPTADGRFDFTVRVADAEPTPRSSEKALYIEVGLDDDGPTVSGLACAPQPVRERFDTQAVVTGQASDVGTGSLAITAVEYFVGAAGDAGTGLTAVPADGIFDSPTEGFTVTLDASTWTAPGTHVVSFRARDLPGNWGASQSISVHVADVTPPAAITDLAASYQGKYEKIYGQPWQASAATAADIEKVIDLGEARVLGGVSLMAAAPVASFPRRLSISVSSNGTDWSVVATQTDYKAVVGINIWQMEPLETRYVKVTATPIYRAGDRLYHLSIPEVAVWETLAANHIEVTWTAPGDDGDDPARGPASSYDLRRSPVAIVIEGFLGTLQVEGVAAPGPAGNHERHSIDTSTFGLLSFAIKAADEAPNWSPMSNAAQVTVAPVGFLPCSPEEGRRLNHKYAAQFFYYRGLDTRQAVIAISDRSDFPVRPIRNGDSTVSRTFRWPVTAGVVPYWKAYPSQWTKMKSLSMNNDSLYWRIEGNSPQFARINGPTRRLAFTTGVVTSQSASPIHSVGSDDGLWPDAAVAPQFTWDDITVGMKYFFVDVSADEGFVLTDRTRTAVLGGKGLNASPYTATAAEWLKVRKLAATSGGVLYWRVRAVEADKVLSVWSTAKKLVIDGGTWTVGDVDLKAASPSLSWTHQGLGLTSYSVQFSSSPDFAPATATVTLPTTPIVGASYALSATDVAKLASLAQRGGVTALYYRVIGTDADGAFVTYSPSATTAAP